jgi:hypothetical protein
MADLVIWQLLKVFKNILRTECQHVNTSSNFTILSYDKLHAPWLLNWSHYNSAYSAQRYNTFTEYALRLPHILSSEPTGKYTVAASFVTYSPWISRALPTGTLAILCNRPIGNISFFAVNASLPAITDDDWMPLSIVALMRAGCKGWKHAGNREHNRADDGHIYVPTSTVECPSGSIPNLGYTSKSIYPYLSY